MSAKRKVNRKRKVQPPPPVRKLKIDQQLDYDDEDFDKDEDYEVERILDVIVHRNNKREFLIRWKGYSSNVDSWEPEENLNCKDLIAKYMDKVEQAKNSSVKDLRPVRAQTQRFTLMTQEKDRRLSKRNFNRQRLVGIDFFFPASATFCSKIRVFFFLRVFQCRLPRLPGIKYLLTFKICFSCWLLNDMV